MRCLVLGCNGLLGQKLVSLAPPGAEIMGSDMQERAVALPEGQYLRADLGDFNQTGKLVHACKPDWILNAAGFTNVDGAETEREICYRANVTAVEHLVHACRRHHARLVHVSTDYVFDGQNGPYSEEDRPNPIGYYGKSKLAGENVLRGSDIHYAVARTMVLYGHAKAIRPNFVTWLIKTLNKNEPVRIVDDQFGNTTLADELAEGLWQIVAQNAQGIYHIAGREIIDRYHFSLQIAEIFHLDPALIRRIKTADLAQTAPRPMNSGLNVDKAMNELGLSLSDARGGLVRLQNSFCKSS
jgi:dTDP-4-dehydrorhamnose reductase